MKKLASVFLMLSMVLAVGCGSEEATAPEVVVEETVVEDEVATGEVAPEDAGEDEAVAEVAPEDAGEDEAVAEVASEETTPEEAVAEVAPEEATPEEAVAEDAPEEATPEEAIKTTYVKQVKGFGGELEVETEIVDGKIVSVTVLNHSETAGIGEPATTEMPARIVEKQSYMVDGVTGATSTSNAIKEAVRLSLEESGADLSKYEVAPEEVVLTQAETETTDVVIVGAGMSGLMAAYEIYETDPDVNFIVVEKLDKIGGSIYGTSGVMYAGDSFAHEATGTEPSTSQDILEWFEEATGEDLNDDVIHTVFSQSRSEETVDMLAEYGAPFLDTLELTTPYNEKLHYVSIDGKGTGMQAFLEKLVEENPIDIRLNTKATALLTDENAVTGIVVEDETSSYEIQADVVILATGGFGSNPEMMELYAPEYADGFIFTNPGATGDGFILTEDLNVNKVGYGTMGPIAASDKKGLIPTSFMINANGQRFVNEKTTGPFSQRAVAEQPDQIAFVIADSSAEDLTPYESAVEKGTAQKYDSIEELAKGINVDVENLTKEIEAYNLAVENNQSPGFDLPVEKATPILKAPFYAQDVTIRVNGTFTSLEINGDLQVVNADGEVIDGLVAAGELTVGNVYTKRTPGGGFGISYAGNSGRAAAQTALEMIKE
ncbi:hypothetical protein AN640_06640 [Candidatus Epulonipiscium fishelsonii]|uniref:Uncharacterized protein n=1 Tax=Candidatus Epulonipiscium fishelsonii TaxID=77094 RepID=A0ACC8XH34_9FIRM|nr:hypothetical protein AN640_06640 [Epulopiscium sp. SCG-D08WGA-EpuloA1]